MLSVKNSMCSILIFIQNVAKDVKITHLKIVSITLYFEMHIMMMVAISFRVIILPFVQYVIDSSIIYNVDNKVHLLCKNLRN